MAIIEHLKDAPKKRGSESDVSGYLAKRVKGVNLGW